MVQLAEKTITLEEFLSLPETKPASEYINGQMTQKSMREAKHSRIQVELASTINTLTRANKVARVFTELRCTFGGSSLVPDVVVLKWEHIPCDENGDITNIITTAPDWTIEILSPGQSQTKVTKNILACLKYGCDLGWLIDPEERAIFVYHPHQQPEFFDIKDQVLPVPQFLPDLKLTVGDIFGWLKL
jgi:Uma2 family endonuclease